jgi:hypothetical protein
MITSMDGVSMEEIRIPYRNLNRETIWEFKTEVNATACLIMHLETVKNV